MNETPFYKTRMGQLFFERTLPEKATQRLQEAVERLAERLGATDGDSG